MSDSREPMVATTAGPMTATDLLVAVLSGIPVAILRQAAALKETEA